MKINVWVEVQRYKEKHELPTIHELMALLPLDTLTEFSSPDEIQDRMDEEDKIMMEGFSIECWLLETEMPELNVDWLTFTGMNLMVMDSGYNFNLQRTELRVHPCCNKHNPSNELLLAAGFKLHDNQDDWFNPDHIAGSDF